MDSKLQKDNVKILLRLRLHTIAFTPDTKQMYRQILVTHEHRRFQRILWGFSMEDFIAEY